MARGSEAFLGQRLDIRGLKAGDERKGTCGGFESETAPADNSLSHGAGRATHRGEGNICSLHVNLSRRITYDENVRLQWL